MGRTYSLAAEVRKADSPISRFLAEAFPHVRPVMDDFRGQIAAAPTIRPSPAAPPSPYATIGAAVDYRLRYYFRETIIQTMDAFRGAQYASGSVLAPEGAMKEWVLVPGYGPKIASQIRAEVSIPRVARDFFDSLDALIEDVHPTRRVLKPEDELRLSRYCFVLALFEHAMRDRQWHKSSSPLLSLPRGAGLDDLLALPHDEWVKDIGRMAWLFAKRHSGLFYKKVRVNPTYRFRTGGFGADADLLVDGSIIDIKTVLSPVLQRAWLYQVVAYALYDLSDSMGIKGVGFYLARQGELAQWSLVPLLRTLSGSQDVSLPDLRSGFASAVQQLW